MKPEQPRTLDAQSVRTVVVRLLLAAVVVCGTCWLAWASLRVGAARFFAEHALRARMPQEAELAAAVAPSDPDAHFARAWLLSNAGDAAGAARAYRLALALRPSDHVLWLELGKELERAGDAEGALSAFQEAVRLAPFYAPPRWQLGNALLRAGRTAEAFAELRRAAAGDTTLYPNTLQIVWYASGRDVQTFVRAASPRTSAEALAVVRFLIKESEVGAGLGLLRETGTQLTEESRRTLVADLISTERFADASLIWSEGHGPDGGTLLDGGFESEVRSDNQGFGWRFAREAQGVKLSVDTDAPREGGRSLKVEYAGGSEPTMPVVARLVAVEPGARYRLTFSARTKELLTGGLPFVQVISAAKSGEVLAETAPLPSSTDGWQDSALEFKAPAAGAVRVALRRRACATSPCPAFGAVWLDAFGLKRLEE